MGPTKRGVNWRAECDRTLHPADHKMRRRNGRAGLCALCETDVPLAAYCGRLRPPLPMVVMF